MADVYRKAGIGGNLDDESAETLEVKAWFNALTITRERNVWDSVCVTYEQIKPLVEALLEAERAMCPVRYFDCVCGAYDGAKHERGADQCLAA